MYCNNEQTPTSPSNGYASIQKLYAQGCINHTYRYIGCFMHTSPLVTLTGREVYRPYRAYTVGGGGAGELSN